MDWNNDNEKDNDKNNCIENEDEDENENFMNDTWALYFHDPDDDAWEIESYLPLATISTVQEVVDLQAALEKYWCNGMFFFMREHILPIWEDKHNASGGCFSYKVMKSEVPHFWRMLCYGVLGESIAGSDVKWDRVCGASISPKRSFCIMRLWVDNSDIGNPTLFNIEHPSYTKIMYRPFSENKV